MEDLWAFNEEVLARAIAASRIPIISCVGHETDFTIADFVADLRAATPSAAAELVSRAKLDILAHVRNLSSRLTSQMEFRLQSLSDRVARAVTSRMLQKPSALMDELLQDVDLLRERLLQSVRNQVEHWDKDLRHSTQKLNLLSPLSTLARGYAVVRALPQGSIVKSAVGVKPEDRIEVQLHEGRLYVQVERTEF